MPLSRLRAHASCFVAAGLILTGCGDDEDNRSKKSNAPAPVPTSATPPPSYDAARVKSSLLPAKEIASGIRSQPVTIEALSKQSIPVCADSFVKIRGKPTITTRQFGPATRRQGAYYAQIAAVYSDAESAVETFNAVEERVNQCPRKRHMPARKVQGSKITLLAYDETWQPSHDQLSGWTHLRGFEKRTYSPSASNINVFYYAYDYVVRGNTLLASIYFERVKPKASSDPIAKRATELLTKQLEKIG